MSNSYADYIKKKTVIRKDTYLNRENLQTYYYSNLNRSFCISRIRIQIPLQCYLCWHTKELPTNMKKNVEKLKKDNPTIQFQLFHEESCRNFIKNHFSSEIVRVYNALIPHSYKRNLWMYCVLYINGGIYLDIKYKCVNQFHLQSLCSNEYAVLERPDNWYADTYGIHTGLLIVKPRNAFMKYCIDAIVTNEKENKYGLSCHAPTGSGLLAKSYFLFTNNEYRQIQLFQHRERNHIYLQKQCILREYPEFQNEIQPFKKYSKQTLWNQHNIYHFNYHVKIQEGTVCNFTNTRLLCVYHIGNYDVYCKMQKYINVILEGNGKEYDLDFQINVIDNIDSEKIQYICNQLPNATIYRGFNYGFDIASFIHIINQAKQNHMDYDYVLKLHTKTCNITRNNILYPLLSNLTKFKQCISMFEAKNVGIISSKFSYCDHLLRNEDINIYYIMKLLKKYFHCDDYHRIPFFAGSMFLMKFSLLRDVFFKHDLSLICKEFHHKETFDYHWYYVANYSTVKHITLSYEALYSHYCKEGIQKGFSRNLLHALVNPNNTSKLLRDGMLEHAYERFFSYIVHKLGHKLKLIY